MLGRPTKRAAVIAGIGLLLVLAGSTAQAGWLFVLAASVLSLIGGSFLTRHNLKSVRVTRSLPARARVGDEVAVLLTVQAGAGHRIPFGRAEDRFEAFDPIAVGFSELSPGQPHRIELVRTTERRGVFGSGDVVLSSGAPFGLVRTRRAIPVASELTVVPRWVDLATFPILEPSSSPSDVVHERARTGAGEEYLGVREYRPGDPRRFVHWKSTARAGKLIVREYEQEVASRVGLVLGGRDYGTTPDSAFEFLVSGMASIGLYSLSTGHPLDAVRADPNGAQHLVSPGRHELLDWLAAAQPTDAPLPGLVGQVLVRIGRRGTVVILAPTAGAAGSSITEAVRTIQGAGARAIVVAARADTWDDSASTTWIPPERAPTRPLVRGKDLLSCLQG